MSLLTGLVSYWKLGEASGARLDAHGSNHLTDHGSVGSAAGKLGNCAVFNGSATQWLSRPTNATLELSTGTAALWYKGAAPGSGFCALVVKQNAYGLFLLDGVFGLYDWGGGAFRSSGVSPTDGGWHHLAASFQSGVAGGLRLYADGSPAGSAQQMTVSGQTVGLAVGAGSEFGQGQSVVGSLDAAGLWARALSAAEVAALYNGGAGREYPFAAGGRVFASGVFGGRVVA